MISPSLDIDAGPIVEQFLDVVNWFLDTRLQQFAFDLLQQQMIAQVNANLALIPQQVLVRCEPPISIRHDLLSHSGERSDRRCARTTSTLRSRTCCRSCWT
jgi:hypothetical protein